MYNASDRHGLGLALAEPRREVIVKTLVEGMGGSISVRSRCRHSGDGKYVDVYAEKMGNRTLTVVPETEDTIVNSPP
jgi:hypothetical protein